MKKWFSKFEDTISKSIFHLVLTLAVLSGICFAVMLFLMRIGKEKYVALFFIIYTIFMFILILRNADKALTPTKEVTALEGAPKRQEHVRNAAARYTKSKTQDN